MVVVIAPMEVMMMLDHISSLYGGNKKAKLALAEAEKAPEENPSG